MEDLRTVYSTMFTDQCLHQCLNYLFANELQYSYINLNEIDESSAFGNSCAIAVHNDKYLTYYRMARNGKIRSVQYNVTIMKLYDGNTDVWLCKSVVNIQ